MGVTRQARAIWDGDLLKGSGSVAASTRLLDFTRHQVCGSKFGIETDAFIVGPIISSVYDNLGSVSKFCAIRIRKIRSCINDKTQKYYRNQSTMVVPLSSN